MKHQALFDKFHPRAVYIDSDGTFALLKDADPRDLDHLVTYVLPKMPCKESRRIAGIEGLKLDLYEVPGGIVLGNESGQAVGFHGVNGDLCGVWTRDAEGLTIVMGHDGITFIDLKTLVPHLASNEK